LIAAVSTAAQAGPAIAAGADMIDATGLSDQAAAAIRARHPGVRLWAGAPAALDADGPGGQATPVAAVVARAAVLTWLRTRAPPRPARPGGAPRPRHAQPGGGDRPPPPHRGGRGVFPAGAPRPARPPRRCRAPRG